MRGKITDVLVGNGTELTEGEVIAILQAMKMDNQIKSPRSGRKSKSRKTSLSRKETLSHSNDDRILNIIKEGIMMSKLMSLGW